VLNLRIYSACGKCGEELSVITKYDTRGEHGMRAGNFIEKRCVTCNSENKIHIDDFKARESKEIRSFAVTAMLLTLGLAVLTLLWLIYKTDVQYVYLGMFSIPFLIYGSMLAYDNNRVSTFNRIFVKR
jgi:hypothetical protein